jgi:LssY-like putative type I secretion system component LssY
VLVIRSLNVARRLNRCVLLTCSVLVLLSFHLSAQQVPAGTVLEARLSAATGSGISHVGDQIEATTIAPLSVRGQILVPQGSKLFGTVGSVSRLALGLKHTTATIHYSFHTLRLTDGETILIKAEVIDVENAKERVDSTGTVHGILPIASLSSALNFYAVPLLCVTPTVGAPVWGVKSLIAPSANPEIYFPAGTEVILRLTAPVKIPYANTEPLRIASFSPHEMTEIYRLLKSSAQRARLGTRPSDVVNLLFLASRKQMDHAFHAAGWSQAERKSPVSLYRLYHALTRRIGYSRAPMNTLTLNGEPADFVYQKNLDTVQKRHHVRLWKEPQRRDVWFGTAAEDIAFRFKLAHWTHSTDPKIDNERAKVVDDLAFTGCLEAAGLLTRNSPDLSQGSERKDLIMTDGDIAVLRLKNCSEPNIMPGVDAPSPFPRRGRLLRALISLRNDLVRSNILFTTYNTVKYVSERRALGAAQPSLDVPQRGLDWLRSTRASTETGALGFHTDRTPNLEP